MFFFSPRSLALWLCGPWWPHVETSSTHGAVISSCWDSWHGWSRPFSFVPTDLLFSPIQPWWLLSHQCLHPQHNEHQHVALFHTQTFICWEAHVFVGSLLLPISKVPEWPLALICTSHTGYFSLTVFRCDKSNPMCSLLKASRIFQSTQFSRSPFFGRIYQSLLRKECNKYKLKSNIIIIITSSHFAVLQMFICTRKLVMVTDKNVK